MRAALYLLLAASMASAAISTLHSSTMARWNDKSTTGRLAQTSSPTIADRRAPGLRRLPAEAGSLLPLHILVLQQRPCVDQSCGDAMGTQ